MHRYRCENNTTNYILQHKYILSKVLYIPAVHVGVGSDQVPSLWHVRVEGVDTVYPSLHE